MKFIQLISAVLLIGETSALKKTKLSQQLVKTSKAAVKHLKGHDNILSRKIHANVQ
jgi:hypothetical protein